MQSLSTGSTFQKISTSLIPTLSSFKNTRKCMGAGTMDVQVNTQPKTSVLVLNDCKRKTTNILLVKNKKIKIYKRTTKRTCMSCESNSKSQTSLFCKSIFFFWDQNILKFSFLHDTAISINIQMKIYISKVLQYISERLKIKTGLKVKDLNLVTETEKTKQNPTIIIHLLYICLHHNTKINTSSP